MKYYFLLQFKRLTRFIKESGINPYLGLGLVVILFVSLSYFFFQKVEYAGYIYSVVALGIVNLLGNKMRNDFLKNCFSISAYKKIRLTENILLATPFFLFLIFNHQIIIAFSLLVAAAALSLLNKINQLNFVLPTPFYKHPFEFIIGFRQAYLLFFLSYILTYISISVNNFNLGIFALIITFLTCLNFYTKPEPLFFVWVYSKNSVGFLKAKIKTAIVQSILLSLPILVFLILFNPDKAHFIIIIEFLGILYVITSLLGKYAYYPSDVNLTQGFVLTFSILFPPLLLIIIPYFYSRSKQNLDSILV